MLNMLTISQRSLLTKPACSLDNIARLPAWLKYCFYACIRQFHQCYYFPHPDNSRPFVSYSLWWGSWNSLLPRHLPVLGTSYNCQWLQECLGSNSIISSYPVSILSCFRVFLLTKHLLCDYIGPWRARWTESRAVIGYPSRQDRYRLCPASTKFSFCVFMDRSINTQKKNLANIHPSWPHAWLIITSSKILTGTQKRILRRRFVRFFFFLVFFSFYLSDV